MIFNGYIRWRLIFDLFVFIWLYFLYFFYSIYIIFNYFKSNGGYEENMLWFILKKDYKYWYLRYIYKCI